MNLSMLKKGFEKLGYVTDVIKFSEVQFKRGSFGSFFVIYQSTEDPDLRYKDYIEDILMGLLMSGARLIPNLQYFRAHHNKVFMEILRKKLKYGGFINSFQFGALEDLIDFEENITCPVVIKPASGSKSNKITLAKNKKQLLRDASNISRSFTLTNTKRAIKSFFTRRGYKPISNNRKKFIVQKFISGFSGDYKVLVYADKYYVVRRENRSRDFRASGSGLLSFPEKVPEGLLNFAESVFKKSKVPFMGMDIGIKNGVSYLIEFQFICMGNYALEKSNFYFKKIGREWKIIRKKSLLEEEFIRSIDKYIKKNATN